MKVLTPQQMQEVEKLSFAQGFSEETFMEQAGLGIAQAVQDYTQKNHLSNTVLLLCAKGNNSGDAYVAGRYLLQSGFKVSAIQTTPIDSCTSLCRQNHNLFQKAGGTVFAQWASPKEGLILDGLYGTGFKGKIQEPQAPVIREANQSSLPILAIDIPSGLNGETGTVEGEAIIASATLFLGAPKKGFFFNGGWKHVGLLHYVNFGLPQNFLDQSSSDLILLTNEFVSSHLPTTSRTWHKYERGYVTGLAGSPDMPGAAILSSWAALTNNAGIVRLIHAPGMEADLACAPVEIVRQTYSTLDLAPVFEAMNKSSAAFIGPGIGRSSESLYVLKEVLDHIRKPCVIDADALSLLAEENIKLPKNVILTPHEGEMMRLLKIKEKPAHERLVELAQEYVDKHNVTLVLKGAPTFILQPKGPKYVNPRGDSCMATAGSGDVLTGMIAAFLSHKLTCHQAALLGVYMHGMCGEYAAKDKTSNCVLASDLITHLPDAYRELQK